MEPPVCSTGPAAAKDARPAGDVGGRLPAATTTAGSHAGRPEGTASRRWAEITPLTRLCGMPTATASFASSRGIRGSLFPERGKGAVRRGAAAKGARRRCSCFARSWQRACWGSRSGPPRRASQFPAVILTGSDRDPIWGPSGTILVALSDQLDAEGVPRPLRWAGFLRLAAFKNQRRSEVGMLPLANDLAATRIVLWG